MKKTGLFISALLIAVLVTTWYSCETDPKETCEQDEICTAKFVTYCCTNNECVYKYDGKEYPEDQIDQLTSDLGCGTTSIVLKSAGDQDDFQFVVEKLKALKARVHARIQSTK
jgi:hypothetical protein